MRLTPSDTVDHVDLNRSFRRPSSSHEERILRRNPPPASFCENFVLAVFSTFSTVSAKTRPVGVPDLHHLLLAASRARPRRTKVTWSAIAQRRTCAPQCNELRIFPA